MNVERPPPVCSSLAGLAPIPKSMCMSGLCLQHDDLWLTSQASSGVDGTASLAFRSLLSLHRHIHSPWCPHPPSARNVGAEYTIRFICDVCPLPGHLGRGDICLWGQKINLGKPHLSTCLVRYVHVTNLNYDRHHIMTNIVELPITECWTGQLRKHFWFKLGTTSTLGLWARIPTPRHWNTKLWNCEKDRRCKIQDCRVQWALGASMSNAHSYAQI